MVNRITVAILCLAAGLMATPAWADFKIERALKLEPGGTFILESDIGDVVLTGGTTSGAQVVVTSDHDLERDFDFSFDESARGATVKIKRRGTMRRLFSGWFENDHTRINIQVPTRTDVRLSTSGGSVRASRLTGVLDVRSSGGSLDVEAVEGNVDGGTSGGSIRMRDVRGNVVANTSGGSITITDVRGSLRADTSGGGINIDAVSGDLRASTSGGSVDVRGAGGRVEASSSGGGVTVRFAPGNSSGGAVSSSGGSVRAEIDPVARVSIDASASGGSVNSDVPVTIQGKVENDSLRGDMNGGGPLLRLRSSGGGVRISAARDANAQGQRTNGKGQK
jgi:DUF4097 and DUF4098 domain-containing protein YvlB